MNSVIKTSTVMLGLAAVASLAACVSDPYSQRNGSTTNTQPVYTGSQPIYTGAQPAYTNTQPLYYAPNAPPEPMAENVPPAPGPSVYWQPGHWGWTGSQWSWLAGHYEQRPYQTAVWEPGHWQQSSNGYFWADGRWR